MATVPPEDDEQAAADPPQPGPLLAAILQAFSEIGPSPTAFRASPAADYICDNVLRRSAPGWWVAFACQLEVVSTHEPHGGYEVVVLKFQGDRVHCGEPFSWELATATDALGQRRLVLQDNAAYPQPLFHILQYRAISECRDALLQHAAMRLGQQLAERPGLKSVVTTVLNALGLGRGHRSQWEPPPNVDALVPPLHGEYMDEHMDARRHPPHASLKPPLPAPPVFKMLDETPRVRGPSERNPLRWGRPAHTACMRWPACTRHDCRAFRGSRTLPTSRTPSPSHGWLPPPGPRRPPPSPPQLLESAARDGMQALGNLLTGRKSNAATARSSQSAKDAAAAAAAAQARSNAAEAFFMRSAAAAHQTPDALAGDSLEPPAPAAPDGVGTPPRSPPQELYGISQLLTPRDAEWAGMDGAFGQGASPAGPATANLHVHVHGRSPYRDLEEQLDSLRARHPERSTESLRQLLLSQQTF